MNDNEFILARYGLTVLFMIAAVYYGKLDAQIGLAALAGLLFPSGHVLSIVANGKEAKK